jgi:ribosomal protein S18 acetylase RimI-like enzyme
MIVRALDARDSDAAVCVLSSAFADDVLLVWAFGARERQGMRAACRTTIALSTAARAAYGYFEGARLLSVALYQRAGQAPSVWQSLRAGFWRVPLQAGPRAAQRIVSAFGRADAFKAKLMGGEPHLYLDTLGVHRDTAGRGIGQALLKASLARLREDAPQPCFLLTHRLHNQRLYRRHGFETLGECPVPASPITFFGMRQAFQSGK